MNNIKTSVKYMCHYFVYFSLMSNHTFYNWQVPFGERAFVRDWLEIQGLILKPAWEHPKRPILGLECTRSEVKMKQILCIFL